MLSVRYHMPCRNNGFSTAMYDSDAAKWHPDIRVPASGGMVILEAPPQQRILLERGGDYPRQHRIKLPYLIFCIRYQVSANTGKYHYTDFYGRGFLLGVANEPIRDFSSRVAPSPIEVYRNGVVCIPHEYDYMAYNSLNELCSRMVNLWYGLSHGPVLRELNFSVEPVSLRTFVLATAPGYEYQMPVPHIIDETVINIPLTEWTQ